MAVRYGMMREEERKMREEEKDRLRSENLGVDSILKKSENQCGYETQY